MISYLDRMKRLFLLQRCLQTWVRCCTLPFFLTFFYNFTFPGFPFMLILGEKGVVPTWRLQWSINKLEKKRKTEAFIQHIDCFSFVFKPMDALWKFPGLSRVGATLFSPVYPFILLHRNLWHWSPLNIISWFVRHHIT